MKFSPLLRFFLSVWLLISLNFFLIRLLPGGPLDRWESLNPLVTENLKNEFRLQDSVVTQYFSYLKNILQGDLGPSISYPGTGVNSVIIDHLWVTSGLNLLALVFVILISVFFIWGLLRNPEGKVAKLVYFLSLSFISAPSILLAPLFILFLSVKLGWVPSAFLKSWWHFLLPAFILSLRPAVYLSRSLTAIMEEEFQKDYVRTAKAKGMSENKILFKHVLKNSIVPILNLLGPLVVGLLSGSAFVEILFAIQGLGHLFVSSLQERDYFLTSGLVLIFGTLLLLLTTFFELLARRVDRRLENLK